MTDTDVMRTNIFTTAQLIQNPLKINEGGTIFATYTPNRIIIRSGENAEVKNQVTVELPDRIFGTFIVLPSIQMLTKYQLFNRRYSNVNLNIT